MPAGVDESARSLYAAYNRAAIDRDISGFVTTIFHPDCEYTPVEEGEPVRGHDALVTYFERWFEPWSEMRADPGEIIVAGELVFVALTVYGWGREIDAEIAQPFFHVLTIRDGMILRALEFLDRLPALAAAGLSDR